MYLSRILLRASRDPGDSRAVSSSSTFLCRLSFSCSAACRSLSTTSSRERQRCSSNSRPCSCRRVSVINQHECLTVALRLYIYWQHALLLSVHSSIPYCEIIESLMHVIEPPCPYTLCIFHACTCTCKCTAKHLSVIMWQVSLYTHNTSFASRPIPVWEWPGNKAKFIQSCITLELHRQVGACTMVCTSMCGLCDRLIM